jgi:outer membrane protein OmpA-like peptidoglycan-associated protein
MKYVIFLAAAAALQPLAASAQSSPSVDSIIRDLKPTATEATGPTRGIRPAAPAAETAEPHAAAAAPSVKLMVDFRTGSAELTPAAEHTLDELGHALTSTSLAKYRFRIEGHTDTVGTPALNKALSTRRAEAVTAYLEKNFQIDAARLDAQGLGSDELPVPTPDQTPEPRNRVVKVVNIGS